MPFATTTRIEPKENSLIVCAGTVTCSSVSAMGSGFMVFKRFFNKNIHQNNISGGWQEALQHILDSYHGGQEEMPAYVRIAQQDSYLGGVATVPFIAGGTGLTFEKISTPAEKEKRFKEQYKRAVEEAVIDAKKLRRPLFLQPLGIGVYGWDAKEAAEIVVEAVCEADPNDEVELTIPIFNPSPGSANELFKETFTAEMAKRKRQPYL
ncbi:MULTISPECIES: hypothetical protein [Legionella]|uniref:RNase III inhibitor n=1 Tax=Legionella drozanskii LLAP-1 TaxID=1212489 RepID=A0A0W0SN51_9GAMM|nr:MULTISPECIES: hypothetical protein [Legionella]KTC84621.1 hypothetical protein Ldro_2785 [Legionella drozanskii LLAP-1]PJE07700.1 MAG: hypothetical protein CK430_13490 [Legionella sp.]